MLYVQYVDVYFTNFIDPNEPQTEPQTDPRLTCIPIDPSTNFPIDKQFTLKNTALCSTKFLILSINSFDRSWRLQIVIILFNKKKNQPGIIITQVFQNKNNSEKTEKN